jgi:hypothetical protein
MEVFTAEQQGVAAVIFHQSDKAEGPRLGELLKSYSGREMGFTTADGKSHRGKVFRVRSCFGRGLMLLPSSEARLKEKDEFVLNSPQTK